MSGTTSLSERMKAEFDLRAQRQKANDAQRAKETQEREKRLERFSRVCDELKPIWRTRLEEFAQQFGDKVRVTPMISPARREAVVVFLTDLATVTLRLSVSTSEDVSKLVLDYELLIIPVFFDYEKHSRLEMPLDNIDQNAVGKWIDDQLISCVRSYFGLRDNEHYVRRAMVEDPITKARFLREDAAETLEHDGHTLYFSSADSLNQYRKKLQLDDPKKTPAAATPEVVVKAQGAQDAPSGASPP